MTMADPEAFEAWLQAGGRIEERRLLSDQPNVQNIPHPAVTPEKRETFRKNLWTIPMDELLKLARGD